MKTVYRKPIATIEYFTLSQSVAAGCGAVAGGNSLGGPNIGSRESCGWDLGNIILWLDDGSKICTSFAGADEDVFGVCYNNPEGGNNIFAS